MRAFALAAQATPPSEAVRVNITIPQDALNLIDAYAEAHGYTRSGFLVKAARQAIAA